MNRKLLFCGVALLTCIGCGKGSDIGPGAKLDAKSLLDGCRLQKSIDLGDRRISELWDERQNQPKDIRFKINKLYDNGFANGIYKEFKSTGLKLKIYEIALGSFNSNFVTRSGYVAARFLTDKLGYGFSDVYAGGFNLEQSVTTVNELTAIETFEPQKGSSTPLEIRSGILMRGNVLVGVRIKYPEQELDGMLRKFTGREDDVCVQEMEFDESEE